VGRERSVALARALEEGDLLVLGAQHDRSVSVPGIADLRPIGVRAQVRKISDRGKRGMLMVVEGLERVRFERVVTTAPYHEAEVRLVSDFGIDDPEVPHLAESLRTLLMELVPKDKALHQSLNSTNDPGRVADLAGAWLEISDDERAEVLHTLDVATRLRLVAGLVQKVRAGAELRSKIDGEVRKSIHESQKEAMLRQQLRAIQKELGEDDDDELEQLRAKLDAKHLPPHVQRVVDRELNRLSSLPPQQAEASVIRRYLELIGDLPWTERVDTHPSIDDVSAVLEADHFGLEEVKKRILEHMAVLKLAPDARGTILCLAGPPGVGKTSLAQSVADATGRPLERVALGGVRDEAEVRGHRRTYVGALPGRIVNAMRKAGVKNPVIVLDEVDKMGRGFQGDPEAALLEVLDPEQNITFTDHYLELEFDLSEVLFIATANDLSKLSPPMLDRLEIIELSGYTTDEKVEIARKHLLPKQLERHGLEEESIALDDEALRLIIEGYTREAGVRQLTQRIAKLCRAVALDVARGAGADAADDAEEQAIAARTVGPDELLEILGRKKMHREKAERLGVPGVAAGLAWTPVGGDLLYVETTSMPGKGKVEITGQLGEVMNESARAALAYLRANAERYGVNPTFLEDHDLHIHVPAGAVPKDGPSAGVTMFSALASLLTGKTVRTDTAMTGEATLRGRVLPVGGIKSKVLAAHRAGMTRVVLPKANEPDIEDVPEAARNELEFIFAEDMSEVFDAVFEDNAASGLVSPAGALGAQGDDGAGSIAL
jgi:ATP-dependent Lon protease